MSNYNEALHHEDHHETIERLRATIRAYVVAVMRAPNNRNEAEIKAASAGLVQTLEEAE
jgi:hypothetical protein